MPAARQARLRECVCQCVCPPGSCPQTLSGLASPFLLQWLWLNTTGSFTEENGEGDKAPATAGPAWHQSQEHPLLCSGISPASCLAPGGQQHIPLLPFWPGDARKGQYFPWGISCWSREADPSVIPPAPLDSASLESTPALLQRGGRRQATRRRHTSSSGERQDLCFQEGK